MKISTLSILVIALMSFAAPPNRTIIELRLYRLADDADEQRMDNYLQNAFIPALHKKGITSIGVFKSLPSDTIHPHLLYVLIPHKSLEQAIQENASLISDSQYTPH